MAPAGTDALDPDEQDYHIVEHYETIDTATDSAATQRTASTAPERNTEWINDSKQTVTGATNDILSPTRTSGSPAAAAIVLRGPTEWVHIRTVAVYLATSGAMYAVTCLVRKVVGEAAFSSGLGFVGISVFTVGVPLLVVRAW